MRGAFLLAVIAERGNLVIGSSPAPTAERESGAGMYRTSTSAPVVITVAQPGAAEYDPGLLVPRCSEVSNLCDSTALVQGRGPMGPASAEYVLPSGSLQAVRANFGSGGTLPSPCGTGTVEDRDDLAFAVGEEVDQTPPTVSITAPANNAPVASSVTVKAEADDDFNVTQVAFHAGETWLGTDTTPPFSVEWHNGNLNQGPYTLTAKACDAAGHVSTSVPIQVIIDHTKPNVVSVSPASEAFVRGDRGDSPIGASFGWRG